MTIDELSRRSGATARNIRSYQTAGLLPPPRVEGRVGHYDEGHLGRLRLIGQLQARGYSLAGIGELLAAWEQGKSLADVLGFEDALTAPWSEEEPEVWTAEQLLELFPQALDDPALAIRSIELGLIVPEEDAFRVPSPSLLRAGAQLAELGVPVAVTQDELAALHSDMGRVAARLVAIFERYVWEPYVAAGMPAERLAEITDALRRMRPLAAISVHATLAQAMEQATAASTAIQATGAASTTSASMREVS